jgi:hypothetical protein
MRRILKMLRVVYWQGVAPINLARVLAYQPLMASRFSSVFLPLVGPFLFLRRPLMIAAPCEKALSQVVAKAWSDAAFKQRLLAGPVAVLRAEGVDVPAGRQVRVVEESDTLAVDNKAWSDAAPRAALAGRTGRGLGMVEESETLHYLILPAKPSGEHVELRGGAVPIGHCYTVLCDCHCV